MKHENNFFLYILGSASLLVLGIMLVFSAGYEYKNILLANISSATFQAQESDTISVNGYISGHVFDGNAIPLADTKVSLWMESTTSISPEIIETTYSDMNGKYFFHITHPGTFFVKAEKQESEYIENQKEIIDNFFNFSHIFTIKIHSGDNYYVGLDFTIDI